MAQTGFTPIVLYHSATGAAAPLAADLAAGELAINTTDEKLYFKNAGGTAKVLANAAIAGITPGTGVATALAVNVGSAGAPVVNGGVLGTPSSGVGTNITNVNAATLGGATFAAPGAIGGGTAAAGSFTTLGASTSISAGTGGTTAAGLKIILGSAGGGSGYGWLYSQNLTPSATNWAFGAKADGLETALNVSTGGSVNVYVENTAKATITSTGLNSTVIGATTPAAGSFTTLGASGSVTATTASGSAGFFDTTTATQYGQNVYYSGGFKFTGTGFASFSGIRQDTGVWNLYISSASGSAGGAITLNNPLSITAAGLAVTGALSATGIVTPGTFTTGTRPTKTLGGIIFDTTLNKLLIGGASAWEVVTSV